MIAARQLGAEVVILDDAFQHLALARDFNLLLMDAARPLGNGHLLPRGVLREPVSALRRAHAVVLTRADRLTDSPLTRRFKQIEAMMAPAPVFTGGHVTRVCGVIPVGGRQMDIRSPDSGRDVNFAGTRGLVFSGIARNDDVCRSVAGLGCRVASRLVFGDHHRYTDENHGAIGGAARGSGADWLITTEKDYVRFAGRFTWPRPLAVIGVDLRLLTGEARLGRLIDTCIEAVPGSPRPIRPVRPE
jgi:tetraacyldisaccharide 4'-kinase